MWIDFSILYINYTSRCLGLVCILGRTSVPSPDEIGEFEAMMMYPGFVQTVNRPFI